MNDPYLEYYGEHQISPVRQDVSDFDLHLARRRKLYRQLGMPVRLFKDADMLEVGPGGGYNTLCFFRWGVRHIDLVEGNRAGVDDMRQNFARHGVEERLYDIYETRIQDFAKGRARKYDIVIAEAFLHYLPDGREIFQSLCGMVGPGGIVVVTCADEHGDLVETMKRMIAHSIVKDIPDWGEKVRILCDVFRPQLDALRGASRSIEDWVKDNLLDSPHVSGARWTMADMINWAPPDLDLLGSSPQILSDWSWYKDVWHDPKERYREQYLRRRPSLLLAGMEDREFEPDVAREMERAVHDAMSAAMGHEATQGDGPLTEALDAVGRLCPLVRDIDGGLYRVCCQMRDALMEASEGEVHWDRYPDFFKAFGRGLQYVSFVRR